MSQEKSVYSGHNLLQKENKKTKGSFVSIDGEEFYKIDHVDRMPAFFMTIVSNSDHWMFISSNGGLSAGRINSESALFPYYTEDKIHDLAETTGSKTILRIEMSEKIILWEPFPQHDEGIYSVERNVYKNLTGNKLLFEEINESLGISFSYQWLNSDQFGFIRSSFLSVHNQDVIKIKVLDGIQNILPYGTTSMMQNEFSNLLNAYKKNELIADSGLGIYSLSSIPVDKAEPSEALIATTVWSIGAQNTKKLISSDQLESFKFTGSVDEKIDIRAKRGAYFLNMELNIQEEKEARWYIIAEVNQGPADVANLNQALLESKISVQDLLDDVQAGTEKLISIVAGSDGLQNVQQKPVSSRHFSNVLFNVMRGGTSFYNYDVKRDDFFEFIRTRNKAVFGQHKIVLERIPKTFNYIQLIQEIEEKPFRDLERLFKEYLPLGFSRRHGDPSRPWNRFSINLTDDSGTEKMNYEGNWRDIFQNWEALGISFPGFIESMICKFVNASTRDGYNPYRITREGIDWEVVDPEDPWSYIGYWGDHQIIYLSKLMELLEKYYPGQLNKLFNREIFSYANVPYRINSYNEILENPQDTVVFDHDLESEIEHRVEQFGTDGKLVLDTNGEVLHVTFIEKIMVSILAKLSNFIPEGGIWLNTQRPEWNDANNALVGSGLSMVTVCYLRRFLKFLLQVIEKSDQFSFNLSQEVADLFEKIHNILKQHQSLLSGRIGDPSRRVIMDALGNAGSIYRDKVYNQKHKSESTKLTKSEVSEFLSISLDYLDHSIFANERVDHLYHAYNILSIHGKDRASISYLYEMLEGQVAVLSAELLSGEQSNRLLESLRKSSLYREDQHSYLLYPDRDLGRFLTKNIIPQKRVQGSTLMQKLIQDHQIDVIERDESGQVHFSGSIRNAEDLEQKINLLKAGGNYQVSESDVSYLLESFEQVFDHKSFTGRSGTFFGYEGLGSIYWHMVSKLILAIQENCFWAKENNESPEVVDQLISHYYDARLGLGFNKTPEEYGAFPNDAYSHTPAHAGAQQPGMTGQVKEDILCRFGELGLSTEKGLISFAPTLLKRTEFLENESIFAYYDPNGKRKEINLLPDSLAFTFCQVPIIYQISDSRRIHLYTEANEYIIEGNTLDHESCEKIYKRTGDIQKIEVALLSEDLL